MPTPESVEKAREIIAKIIDLDSDCSHGIGYGFTGTNCKICFPRIEVVLSQALDEAVEGQIRKDCGIACSHFAARGTGKGIYDMQYKDCCQTAETILNQLKPPAGEEKEK